MEDESSILPPPKRMPWNKGKLIGAKPPLLARPQQVRRVTSMVPVSYPALAVDHADRTD
jgi:hypothetical protein